ncbi:hypothetical protein Q7P37_007922 [Cladosporium fusiforme]
MKSTTILALAGAVAAADYANFDIPWLEAHQPSGQKFDYYNLEFNVTSSNGDTPTSAYCRQWWGDNGGDEAWSTGAPVNKWHPCTLEKGSEEPSTISFYLFPYYSIGNFSLALSQNFTETIAGFSLPIATAGPACPHAKTVSLTFPVTIATEFGESVYVVGSIPELGNWDLKRAVPLNADKYATGNYLWDGGNVKVAAGTTFQWKPVKKTRSGRWHWSCNDNISTTVDRFTCGKQAVTEQPTYFACPS